MKSSMPSFYIEMVHLRRLLEDLKCGKLVFAEYAALAWSLERELELLDSIRRGFPIGSILLWKSKSGVCHVLDGLERLGFLGLALADDEDSNFHFDAFSDKFVAGAGPGRVCLSTFMSDSVEGGVGNKAWEVAQAFRDYMVPAIVFESQSRDDCIDLYCRSNGLPRDCGEDLDLE